jgi:hypothetical protein
MTDRELRGLALRAIYDRRQQPVVSFKNLVPNTPEMEVSRILKQLEDSGLISWTFKDVGTGLGSGQITSYGTQVIEGELQRSADLFGEGLNELHSKSLLLHRVEICRQPRSVVRD